MIQNDSSQRTELSGMKVVSDNDKIQLARLGSTKAASIFGLMLNPCDEADKALNFLLVYDDITEETMCFCKRFVADNEVLIREIKSLPSNSRKYRHLCRIQGKEFIDLMVDILQQFE